MKGGELSAGISSGQKCLDVDFLFTKLPRKSGSIGKIMDVPMEAPSCGIATQAVYAGVISSFLYGCLTNKKLKHQSCGCAVEWSGEVALGVDFDTQWLSTPGSLQVPAASEATTFVISIHVSRLQMEMPWKFQVIHMFLATLQCICNFRQFHAFNWHYLRHGLYCPALRMVQEYEAGRLFGQCDGWRPTLGFNTPTDHHCCHCYFWNHNEMGRLVQLDDARGLIVVWKLWKLLKLQHYYPTS